MSASVTVRMYNQHNLGDCFLLKFEAGNKKSFMLIDFGSYTSGNDEREIEIARSIKDTVHKEPLIVVLTHQHKDHLSGFITAKEIIDDLNITEVWFSFLDDPTGKEAKAMRKATEKFWKKNKENKSKTKLKFNGVAAVEKMLAAKEGFDLFAEDQTGGEAITNLLEWSNNNCQFLVPGKNFDMPGLPAESVRVYVLGPPTDPTLLRKLNPGKNDAVNSLNAMMQLSNLDTSSKLVGDSLDTILNNQPLSSHGVADNFPFNRKFIYPLNNSNQNLLIEKVYINPSMTWRRIDHDWLSELGRVSLHMDTLTNNSSLVLAFELVISKKVVLFVGDAQIGNWKSWFDIAFEDSEVEARELLSRTVFYKAGHHSSHNATLLESLDLMNDKELVIMIPINKEVSEKMNFAMLKPGMMAGYNRKSKGRVLRSDTIFHDAGTSNKFKFKFAKQDKDFTPKLIQVKDEDKSSHLFIEYTVK
ncbi:MAG TPA: hypothetical protein VMY77_00980 [Chitinophagaceae bacterium]|nr:hypothetical protein [Chitinophagaceae bacterium]